MFNAVLPETFRPLATAVAAKADGSARDAKIEQREHERLPNDGLTAGAVDK
jgi:hypothetical protein